MSYTVQLSPQQQVSQHARKFADYKWFDADNRKRALELLEAYAYSVLNNVPNLPVQYKKQAVSVLNKDKAEQAVSVGKKLGLTPKVFAVHCGSMAKPFTIKSSKFDWKVLPIEISNEPVPAFVMRNLMAFRQAGFVFDGYGVAVPDSPNYCPTSTAIKQEIISSFQQVEVASRKVIQKIYDETKTARQSIAKRTSRAVSNTSKAFFEYLVDPVFIGSYGEDPAYLVEIGRWI